MPKSQEMLQFDYHLMLNPNIVSLKTSVLYKTKTTSKSPSAIFFRKSTFGVSLKSTISNSLTQVDKKAASGNE